MQFKVWDSGGKIDYTPNADVALGQVVMFGNFPLIAERAIEANVKGSLAPTLTGDLVKKNGVTFTAGDPVIWDVDGDPLNGVAGSGAAVSDASLGKVIGICVADAAADDETVRIITRVIHNSATQTLSLDDLTDIGTMAYDAGKILVADGNKLEPVAVSGDVTVAASGAMTVNAAIKEKEVLIPIAALGANGDLAALTVFGVPRAATLVSVGYLSGGDGDFGVIDDANTSVFALTDGAGNAIVSKTFNTATQPTANALNDLGALSAEHKVLTAAEICKLAITNGATAKTPAGFLVIRYLSTNA